jgi:hypothetical protein
MAMPVSLAEVRDAGVTIEADEAVAIAQELIVSLRSPGDIDVIEPPFGPPAPANVYLQADGSLVCRACVSTPAVSEMAIFLQSLLSAPVRTPSGLRYAIARALLDVDAAPFDSLDDFSETLARYERGPRRLAVRRILLRFHARHAFVPVPSAPPVMLPRPSPRSFRAAAACIAAGLFVIAGGEYADRRWQQTTPPPPAISSANPAPRTGNQEPRAEIPELGTPNLEPRTANSESPVSNPAATREVRPERVRATRAGRRAPAPRHLLDRLRLGWLRHALKIL